MQNQSRMCESKFYRSKIKLIKMCESKFNRSKINVKSKFWLVKFLKNTRFSSNCKSTYENKLIKKYFIKKKFIKGSL